MKNAFVVSIAISALLAGSAKDGASEPQNKVLKADELLPKDGQEVDVMDLAFSSRHTELASKFQRAIQKDPEWALSYAKKAKPGEPLPYDPRLGLTKEEYKEFLKLAEQITLKKVKATKLRVARKGTRFTLEGGQDLAELKGIELDLEANAVTTPFGKAKFDGAIMASEGQKTTGPWNGLGWKLEDLDEKALTGTVVSFSLGRMEKTGRGILYYDVKQVGERSKRRITYLLLYDLKPLE